ncbi:hypothetical protein [Citrobacter enshiensis]|uniref:hypothetical protein n=1 Tax=Citrobacter enshiensis TaxID=2971264 RepID=UPI0023E776BC|nr:hypothetical protein [Citrobacter enshiensis]WET42265.1 hypothetical protein P2W74_08970 [Citrobacter enshiensis]
MVSGKIIAEKATNMISTIKFSANFVSCYTEHNVPVIGIGDDPEEPKHYIIISQFIDKNESFDDSIGLQGHFFESEISNAIKKIQINKSHLIIDIKEGKGQKIGIDKIHIDLYIANEEFEQLYQYIIDIFDKSTTIIELKK